MSVIRAAEWEGCASAHGPLGQSVWLSCRTRPGACRSGAFFSFCHSVNRMLTDIAIFVGSASSSLGGAIAARLGLPLGAAAVERFPDGECSVRLLEPVRCRRVFVIQSTSPPADPHLVELLLLVDACRRAGAARITAVVPYFGYARSDKRHGRRDPVGAAVVAQLLEVVGVDHLLTLDLHATQIEGFFRIPVDALTAVPALCQALRDREHLPPGVVVVSPDAGRVKTAGEYARRLDTPVAILHKRRLSGTSTEVTHVVGDVRGRPCVIIDDMVSTGGTLARAIDALLSAGARQHILVAAAHGPLLDSARSKLEHPSVRRVLVTDTVERSMSGWPGWEVVSISELLASAIRRIADGESLATLY
jgi:ribose-phosphate pyrophosphokinase